MALRSAWRLVAEAFNEWFEDGVSQIAASLAFYTVFSLAPMLVILMAVVGALYGEEGTRTQILEHSQQLVGERGTQIVEAALEDAHRNSAAATIVGIVGVLFGATVVFVSLQDALNYIWGVAPKPGSVVWPFVRKRLVSFLMILALGLMLLVSLAATTAVSAFVAFASSRLPAVGRYLEFIDFIVWLGLLTVSFAVVYKVLPDVKIAWPDVWAGAATAALLFTVGKTLLGIYLARSTVTSAFGAAGSLAVLLLWVYYSAQIFLLGGEFTQVYARRRGPGIIPDEHAIKVEKTYDKAA